MSVETTGGIREGSKRHIVGREQMEGAVVTFHGRERRGQGANLSVSTSLRPCTLAR